MGNVSTDGCEDDCLDENYEWVMHDADEQHAENCSPFCGCSCCQSITLSTPTAFQALISVNDRSFLSEAARIPEDPGHPIWQPPKI